jgi:hypothetical protein
MSGSTVMQSDASNKIERGCGVNAFAGRKKTGAEPSSASVADDARLLFREGQVPPLLIPMA